MGEVEKAKTEAEKVIELNPNISTSYYILGLVYDESGNLEKRDENLIKAAELNFAFKDKSQILRIINLLVKEKKYNAIKNLYIQAIQIDPDDISLYTGLAATYAKMHNKEGLFIMRKKYLEMNPGSKQAVEAFIQLVENEQWELIAD